MKLPDFIQKELDACGLPWRVEQGSKHQKIYVADVFAGIVPLNARKETVHGRGGLNLRSQIRKIARTIIV